MLESWLVAVLSNSWVQHLGAHKQHNVCWRPQEEQASKRAKALDNLRTYVQACGECEAAAQGRQRQQQQQLMGGPLLLLLLLFCQVAACLRAGTAPCAVASPADGMDARG